MKTVQNSMNGSLSQAQVDTDTSTNKSENIQVKTPAVSKKLKKRIGPFSFYLSDIIGQGYSSFVYKGIKDNDKQQVVAIKVIDIQKMNSHRKNLLQNEAKILKMLDHPNIVKLLDIFYTNHNCYIITQFCQKGSLQTMIDQKQEFSWTKAAFEIGKACQYLASKFILHRDIKPANILIRNGIFKLGDFGFSIILNSENHIIKQQYLIGSPLYMPPQAHKKNHYSLKGDAFAFGVLVYYLSTKHYPWKGKDKFDLIKHYEKNLANQRYMQNFPPKLKHYLNGLLRLNEYERFSISSLDLQLFNHIKISNNVERQLKSISKSYDIQIKMCQFLNLLKVNFLKYQSINPYLNGFLTNHLRQLIYIFEWVKQSALNQLAKNYNLPQVPFKFNSDDYFWMSNCLKDTIKIISQSKQNSSLLGLLQKLVHYHKVIQCIQFQSETQLAQQISKLTLHYSFELVKPNLYQLNELIGDIDFYQL